MPRTTPELVGGVIKVRDDVDLTPFILTATDLVSELCVDSDGHALYSDKRMEMIERWLAAHFYAVDFPRRHSEGAAGVAQTLQHASPGQGLASTDYGQQAMRLDTKLKLAALNNAAGKVSRGTAKLTWLGTTRRRW